MKIIIFIVALAFLVACAAPSTLKFNDKGKLTDAQNYIIADQKAVYTPNIPDNWFTSAMKQMLDAVGPYLGMFKEFFGGGKTVISPVSPVPAPPAPRPYP